MRPWRCNVQSASPRGAVSILFLHRDPTPGAFCLLFPSCECLSTTPSTSTFAIISGTDSNSRLLSGRRRCQSRMNKVIPEVVARDTRSCVRMFRRCSRCAHPCFINKMSAAAHVNVTAYAHRASHLMASCAFSHNPPDSNRDISTCNARL